MNDQENGLLRNLPSSLSSHGKADEGYDVYMYMNQHLKHVISCYLQLHIFITIIITITRKLESKICTQDICHRLLC